jgi:hypothetical protein
MKKIIIGVVALLSFASYSAEKEYLVDSGTSGYLSGKVVGSGDNVILELTSISGEKYSIEESRAKVVAERVHELKGYKDGIKVLYTYDYSNGAVVTREAEVLKVYDNDMALIYVKSYKKQGYHPYLYTELRRLSF